MAKEKRESVHRPDSQFGGSKIADHLVPSQVLGFFEFFREKRGGSFLFSKACKSLYRRRFKEFEDAPFAAHKRALIINCFTISLSPS